MHVLSREVMTGRQIFQFAFPQPTSLTLDSSVLY
jgi:hypothetical protein